MTDADSRPHLGAGLGLLLLALVLCGCGGGITPISTAFNQGVYQYSQGNYPMAAAEYREALEDDPEDHRARFNLALTLETLADERRRSLRGERDPEVRAAGEAEIASLVEEARGHYQRILDTRPNNLRAAVNLAAIEYEAGDAEGAKTRLRQLIEAHPGVPLPRTALSAHLIREAADAPDAATRDALRQEARVQLESAVSADDASFEARTMLGDLLRSQGDWEAAKKAYQKALERDPSDIATMMGLARTELGGGDRPAAIPWLRRVLFLDRDAWEANYLLGMVLGEQGLEEDETATLEEAITLLWRARRLDSLRPSWHERPDYDARLDPLMARMSAR